MKISFRSCEIIFQDDLTELFECYSMQNKFYFPIIELPPKVVYHRVFSILSTIASPTRELHCTDVFHSTEQQVEPKFDEIYQTNAFLSNSLQVLAVKRFDFHFSPIRYFLDTN